MICETCKFFDVCEHKEEYFKEFELGRVVCGDYLKLHRIGTEYIYPLIVYPLTKHVDAQDSNYIINLGKERQKFLDAVNELNKTQPLLPDTAKGLKLLIGDELKALLSNIAVLLQAWEQMNNE